MVSKKYLIVLILRILETNTDSSNPLTQTKIAKMISPIYACDRKTVGRNIKFLKEVGYPIIKTNKGFYMGNKTFTRDDVALVLSLVQNSECDVAYKTDLKDRLTECLTRYYER